jgi:hypothetical protein
MTRQTIRLDKPGAGLVATILRTAGSSDKLRRTVN